ncbi:myosin-9-like [Dorcoceras hygrometricum]|uniref:Myosin-9-like n=1 Tax=Dorcoceras hygrometricum TaxID=472368 RepID=A0A2Z7ALR6_9LAMI|nr:myosin-9-like [Dorcoceras hygrometricum]
MTSRRKEPSDKNKEIDSMPELEELQATDEDQQEISVQGMVDRIEGHSHGHTMAKQPAEPQEDILEKNVVDTEEASKVMTEGVLAYMKQ